MHPLKLVEIKKSFGFLQSNPQILAELVKPIFLIKKVFLWDTLITIHIPALFVSALFLYHEYDGGEKDNSLPGRVSAHRVGGLDICEFY